MLDEDEPAAEEKIEEAESKDDNADDPPAIESSKIYIHSTSANGKFTFLTIPHHHDPAPLALEEYEAEEDEVDLFSFSNSQSL